MRLRLLPVLMFGLVATTTIKLGAVWHAVDISVGTQSLAQTQPTTQTPPSNPPPSAAATPQPATPGSATPTAAPASTTNTTATQTAAPAANTSSGAAQAPTVQAGTTPDAGGGLPQAETGGMATEGDAAAAQTATVPDPFDYTDEEIDVLQQLSKRREALELRARQLDEREALIQAAEQRMDQKMAELKALQAMVEDLLKKHSDEQEAELKSLVKMYENMKPKDAAQVFEEMDMDVLLDVVERMNERKAAPILALVTPTRAKEITFELAQRKVLPLPQ